MKLSSNLLCTNMVQSLLHLKSLMDLEIIKLVYMFQMSVKILLWMLTMLSLQLDMELKMELTIGSSRTLGVLNGEMLVSSKFKEE